MTKEFSYYVIDVGVAYKEDTDHVVDVLQKVGQELQSNEAFGRNILVPLEILGVNDFADSAVTIKIRIKTLPMKQWMVGRELRRRIKKAFDAQGIEIPFPHMSLYFGEASKPFVTHEADPAELVSHTPSTPAPRPPSTRSRTTGATDADAVDTGDIG